MIILKHHPNTILKICCLKCFFPPLANILFPWQEEQRELAQCWKTENQFSVTEVTKNSWKNPRNLRTGSGFARTNLALVLWTRSRGDAHGGEIDISDFFALNVVSNFSFKLQKYFLSSPTSHLPGVQRPTDCLWSGSEAWARFKLSSTPSADWGATLAGQGGKARVLSQGQALLSTMKGETPNLNLIWQKIRYGLSLARDWSVQGFEGSRSKEKPIPAKEKSSWRSQPVPRTNQALNSFRTKIKRHTIQPNQLAT